MRDVAIADLTFPMVKYGKTETPLDLRILLFKGGAKCHIKKVFNQIVAGELGRPLIERMELVQLIHEAMSARLVGGGAKASANSTLRPLRSFFGWADEFEQVLSLETVEDTYRHWVKFQENRTRLKIISKRPANPPCFLG